MRIPRHQTSGSPGPHDQVVAAPARVGQARQRVAVVDEGSLEVGRRALLPGPDQELVPGGLHRTAGGDRVAPAENSVVATCAALLRWAYDDLHHHGSSCPASGGHDEHGAGTRSLMSGPGADRCPVAEVAPSPIPGGRQPALCDLQRTAADAARIGFAACRCRSGAPAGGGASPRRPVALYHRPTAPTVGRAGRASPSTSRVPPGTSGRLGCPGHPSPVSKQARANTMLVLAGRA